MGIVFFLKSIRIMHLVQMIKTHISMYHLLSAVNYQEQKWLMCRDLKVVGLVLDLQSWYTNDCLGRQ